MSTPRIVIIGAGISGLSAALYLKRRNFTNITILEKAAVPGGKIATLHHEGLIIERGADSFLAKKQAMLDLAADLGLSDQLVGTSPSAKHVYIAGEHKLHPFPKGLRLAIPSDIGAILRTPTLTPFAKLRVLADLLLPGAKHNPSIEDESLGQLLTRRFGQAFAEQIAEPILAGIYAGDLDKISVQATFPQFAEMERCSGSLIRAMRKQLRAEQQEARIQSMFLAFRGGFSQLTSELLNQLTDVELHCGCAVERISGEGPYLVRDAAGNEWQADELIVTVPSFSARKLFAPLADIPFFQHIEHVSVANVIFAFDKQSGIRLPEGSGFLVPRRLNKLTTACTWTSNKWTHTAPDGSVLLRAYVGRDGQQNWQRFTDEQLTSEVLAELRDWMDIPGEPTFIDVNRWPLAMPQYAPGHRQRLQAMRDFVGQKHPNFRLIGASYDAVGLPDCVLHARQAAFAIADTYRE